MLRSVQCGAKTLSIVAWIDKVPRKINALLQDNNTTPFQSSAFCIRLLHDAAVFRSHLGLFDPEVKVLYRYNL